MRRREFSQALAALAAIGLQRLTLAAAPGAKVAPVPMGTNLSGMEWAKPGLRLNLSSAPNLHFSVPRKADVAYLASCGFTQNRLPIQWELLQPMLAGTQANARARALIGEPGQFHAVYEGFITGVLDAHAAVGMRCILDLHNYARYQDFRYQSDGAVIGLSAPPSALMRPYTTDKAQVQERLFALAPGASLTPAHFADFWRRAAEKWHNHPGLGGYGLMNEPHDLPAPGGLVESPYGREDLHILPVFMQAAIEAIRAIDPRTPIYVAGNEWSGAASIAAKNPAYPLNGEGLIYEVHAYLDRRNTGQAFDWDSEAAPKTVGGKQQAPMTLTTGRERIAIALDWAKAHKVRLALGEIGMPIDDARWAHSFRSAVALMLDSGFEVYSWLGGSHWPIRNHPLNHVPGWHQSRTLEPLVSGVMKAAAGIAQAALFDDGPGYAPPGQPVRITVYARGHLVRPLRLKVALKGSGKLGKTQLTIPAGPNGQDVYIYTPADDEVASLRYISDDSQLAGRLPPPRRVYSLADPPAHASVSLDDAAMAILGKYGACKWDMADAHTDYVLGRPAADGQPVRAVSDSGYGCSPGNAMEMVNGMNLDSSAMGAMALPLMRVRKGRKSVWFAGGEEGVGLWCKKSVPVADIQPNPVNRVPYNLEDAHFALAAISIAAAGSTGLVFQASTAEERQASELGLVDGRPMARWVDARGQTVRLLGPDKLAPGMVAVISFTSAPRAQALRVDSRQIESASALFAPSVYAQMLIGWGFLDYYPRAGFAGHIHALITGKGVPSAAELMVLERFLAHKATGLMQKSNG